MNEESSSFGKKSPAKEMFKKIREDEQTKIKEIQDTMTKLKTHFGTKKDK